MVVYSFFADLPVGFGAELLVPRSSASFRCFSAAHRFRCASAMRLRASADIV